MRKSKGFSLIELIVVIAIMSVLTGVLTPMFMRYVHSRRQLACRENREAILNIYEKCVYGGFANVGNTATDFDFKNFVQTSTLIPGEYKAQFDSHWICSDGGNFTVKIVDGVAYCECSSHDAAEDLCTVDIIGWDGEKVQYADAVLPFSKVEPDDESHNDPEEEDPPEDDPPQPAGHGYWPYADHPIWNTEASAGYHSDSHIYLKVPSGKFAGRTAPGATKVYYVAVSRNGGADTKITRTFCENPEYYVLGNGGAGGSEFLVLCSGRELTADGFLAAISEDPTSVENPNNYITQEYNHYNTQSKWVSNEKGNVPLTNLYSTFEMYLKDIGEYDTYLTKYGIDTSKGMELKYDYNAMKRNGRFKVSFGDIVKLDNGWRYILGSSGENYTSLPAQDCTALSSGNWYRLAPESEDEL